MFRGQVPQVLEVLTEKFEMVLGMIAGGACIRCGITFVHVPTVSAAPYGGAGLLEDRPILDVGRQRKILLFMLLFSHGDRLGFYIRCLCCVRRKHSHLL